MAFQIKWHSYRVILTFALQLKWWHTILDDHERNLFFALLYDHLNCSLSSLLSVHSHKRNPPPQLTSDGFENRYELNCIFLHCFKIYLRYIWQVYVYSRSKPGLWKLKINMVDLSATKWCCFSWAKPFSAKLQLKQSPWDYSKGSRMDGNECTTTELATDRFLTWIWSKICFVP